MSSYTCKYCGMYISHIGPNWEINPDPATHILFCPARRWNKMDVLSTMQEGKKEK